MAVHFHEEDIPEGLFAPGAALAVDTETMGLVTQRDRLCVVQISDGGGDEHLVRFAPDSSYEAPNLTAVLEDPARLKLFHFARGRPRLVEPFEKPGQACLDAVDVEGRYPHPAMFRCRNWNRNRSPMRRADSRP
mgnify:CR=1 FL=1